MAVLEITTYGRNTLRRLRREATIIDAGLVPRLARAYEIDPYAPTATLVAGYLPDITLDDLIGVSPLPAAAALHALRDVARTLHALHDDGLGHGDLRPGTVLVLPDGRAALTRPESPPAHGTDRVVRDIDARGFASLARDLLPSPPPPAKAVLDRALSARPGRRPLPLALVEALDAVPAEEWATNHLRRTTAPPPPPPLARPLPPVGAPRPAGPAPTAPAGVSSPRPHRPLPDRPRVVVRIVPPAPRRSLLRRVVAPFVVTVGLLTVLSGGGAGAWLLFAPAKAGDPVATPLEVRRISVSVTPPQALCPHASLHLAARIVTAGGGGTLEVRWRLPDGTTTAPQTVTVDEGRQTARATFDLTLSGPERLVGDVVAVVDPTGTRASAPIRYLCSRSSRSRSRVGA